MREWLTRLTCDSCGKQEVYSDTGIVRDWRVVGSPGDGGEMSQCKWFCCLPCLYDWVVKNMKPKN